MPRLDGGIVGMSKAVAIATTVPGGTGAVASALIMDELEYHRAGIGCVLEDNPETGDILIGKIMPRGAASSSGLCEGDVLEQVDEHPIHKGMSVSEASHFIRGREGSVVTLQVRRGAESRATIRIVRQRVPGSETEMLGALWQKSHHKPKSPKVVTKEDKLEKLVSLRKRGLINDVEFEHARLRLMEGKEGELPKQKSSFSYTHMFQTLQSDFEKLFTDPEILRRRQQLQSAQTDNGDYAVYM
uniref:PDZ domain-containing protein n=1 Tax=Hanusia phi TaxID=3032 RepID=A0A7S0E4K6_9CRYP|mmetsp:Transcript_16578/g.37867  ORF Transcript_16578/g.37867 Transcript_16578/m.37867 type:complete len:243 (+) Transcript_16578:41-769(+)